MTADVLIILPWGALLTVEGWLLYAGPVSTRIFLVCLVAWLGGVAATMATYTLLN